MDDIIIFSKTFDEHLSNLEEVFQRIRNANLKIKFSKCSFAKRSNNYIGHIISKEEIRMDPNKIKIFDKIMIPKSVKEFQKILGLSRYYGIFVKFYSIFIWIT